MKKKDQESLRKIVIIGLVLVVGYLGYQSMTSDSSPIGEASEPTVPGRYGDISNVEEALEAGYSEDLIEKIGLLTSSEKLIEEKKKEIEDPDYWEKVREEKNQELRDDIEEKKREIGELEGFLEDPGSDYWEKEREKKNQGLRDDFNNLRVNAEEMREFGEKLTPDIARELEAMIVRIVDNRDFLDDKSVGERLFIEEILEAHDKITGGLDWQLQRRSLSLMEGVIGSISPYEEWRQLIEEKKMVIEEMRRHIEAIEAIVIKTVEIKEKEKEIEGLKDYD